MGLEDYKIIRCVGKGSFGKVYLCRHIRENKHYCMKCIKLTNIPAAERAACRHEVKLMQRLNHPNIVGYKDSFFAKRGSQLCIVMTYCDGGDLSDRVKRQTSAGRRFKEDQVLHWFVQIALGLHFMHENRVLHRDLKTQNIFLLGNGRLVLGDLGISKVLEGKQDFAQTCIGTPYYMSPELFKNKPYNHKSDVWALGCILYELCTLKHAFDAKSLNGLASKILKGTYPPVHRSYSSHTRRLIKSMLSKSPHQRPDLSTILQMPFIKKRVANFMSDVIMSKPTQKVGAGTMVVRGAFMQLGGIQGAAGGIDANSAKDMLALQSQLDALGMKQMIADALNKSELENEDDSSSSSSSSSSGNSDRSGVPPRHGKGGQHHQQQQQQQRGGSGSSSSSSNAAAAPRGRSPSERRKPLEPRIKAADARAAEARRRQAERQRDARDALRREKERKAAVEHALEKLRKEREARLRERKEQESQRNARNRHSKLRQERKKKEHLRLKKAQRLKAEQDRQDRQDRQVCSFCSLIFLSFFPRVVFFVYVFVVFVVFFVFSSDAAKTNTFLLLLLLLFWIQERQERGSSRNDSKGSRKSTKEELLARKEREARAIDVRSKRRQEAAESRLKKLKKEKASKLEKEQQRKRMVRQRSEQQSKDTSVQQEIDNHRELRRVASAASAAVSHHSNNMKEKETGTDGDSSSSSGGGGGGGGGGRNSGGGGYGY